LKRALRRSRRVIEYVLERASMSARLDSMSCEGNSSYVNPSKIIQLRYGIGSLSCSANSNEAKFESSISDNNGEIVCAKGVKLYEKKTPNICTKPRKI
jgi:hypothetical protein